MTPEIKRANKIVARNNRRDRRAQFTWLNGHEDQTMVTAFKQLTYEYNKLVDSYNCILVAADALEDQYIELKKEVEAKRAAELENMDICKPTANEVDTA